MNSGGEAHEMNGLTGGSGGGGGSNAPLGEVNKPQRLWQRNGPININHYANKKSAAESMLDIALLMANASQLKAVMEQGPTFSFYVPLIVLISISLTLQIGVGVLLIFLATCAHHFLPLKSPICCIYFPWRFPLLQVIRLVFPCKTFMNKLCFPWQSHARVVFSFFFV
ncbi:ninjurin-1 isoform X1 [Sphaerodactylus townsendi]|uniref:ninjurin-1 isoform X1 n=1 Tax=Sphaerodactylus townsendi TaxID=933632 RepID=UPI0020264F90|nr:ninjurin-1 isoform X1 [Sphaerodactylus townsendi]